MVEIWFCEHNKGVLGAAPPLCSPFCRSGVLHLPELQLHHANVWVQYQEIASRQLWGDAKREQFSENAEHELGDVACHPHSPSPHCSRVLSSPLCRGTCCWAPGWASAWSILRNNSSSSSAWFNLFNPFLSCLLEPQRTKHLFFFLCAGEAWCLHYKHLSQRETDYLSSPTVAWKS